MTQRACPALAPAAADHQLGRAATCPTAVTLTESAGAAVRSPPSTAIPVSSATSASPSQSSRHRRAPRSGGDAEPDVGLARRRSHRREVAERGRQRLAADRARRAPRCGGSGRRRRGASTLVAVTPAGVGHRGVVADPDAIVPRGGCRRPSPPSARGSPRSGRTRASAASAARGRRARCSYRHPVDGLEDRRTTRRRPAVAVARDRRERQQPDQIPGDHVGGGDEQPEGRPARRAHPVAAAGRPGEQAEDRAPRRRRRAASRSSVDVDPGDPRERRRDAPAS